MGKMESEVSDTELDFNKRITACRALYWLLIDKCGKIKPILSFGGYTYV